jgi:predicted RNase H-like nuclease
MLIIGIDLAWGDKKPDGVAYINMGRSSVSVKGFAYPRGDEELMTLLNSMLARQDKAFITVDAPIVCPNLTGTRPVDRLTHTLFHREHAACHPANRTKCPRPVRVREKLEALGIVTGWDLHGSKKLVAEVYPHPAMVRLFKLRRIVKYKKGTVDQRRSEFRRLQRLLRRFMGKSFPDLILNHETKNLLKTSWSKPVEDLTDALFCALIGLWHVEDRGSEIIGDLSTGFILLPLDQRPRRENSARHNRVRAAQD